MKHVILGGGNIGTLLLAEIAHNGNKPVLYTQDKSKWSDIIDVYDSKNNFFYSVNSYSVTNSLVQAVSNADIIWITYPAAMFPMISKQLLPIVEPGQVLIIIPGAGGAEFAFQDIVYKGCALIGFERVHSIARLRKYGSSVTELGRKNELSIASIPTSNAAAIAPYLEELFDMPCRTFGNYLNVTLVPSNQILHTTRLYSMFANNSAADIYERNFYFYREWDDASSEIMLACDQELQKVCQALNRLDLSGVRSLRDHYESYSISSMTRKIASIPAFSDILTPMMKSETGWVLDFSSRYFKSDFSYGLKIIKDIAELASVSVNHINAVWDWYTKISNDTDYFLFGNMSLEEFYEIYQQ